MNGTTYPSSPCYLPLFENRNDYGLERYTNIFRNFIEGDCRVSGIPARDRIKMWNGTVINDVVVFDTEQDKMWFVLRWS